MKLVLLFAFIATACALEGFQSHEPKIVPREFMIRLNEEFVRTERDEELIIHTLESLYKVYVVKVFHFTKMTILHVKGERANVMRVEHLPAITYVEPNKLYSIAVCTEYPAPGVWGLDRTDQVDQLDYTRANSPDAVYKYGEDEGTGVVAYVADTGIDWEHPNFGGRARFGYSVYDNRLDGNGHGTHCAGTIGSDSYGIAKDVDLVAVKVLSDFGTGTTARIVEGLEWIEDDHNARSGTGMAKSVVNLSLGGSADTTFDNAVQSLIDAGVVVVAAAGNSDNDACTMSPGRVADAVTVCALDVLDHSASFTSYGSCVDVCAPGVDVLSTQPGDSTAIFSGTSMACPHVVGVVARYQSSQAVTPTPAAVSAWLASNANKDKITWHSSDHGRETPNLMLHGDCPL